MQALCLHYKVARHITYPWSMTLARARTITELRPVHHWVRDAEAPRQICSCIGVWTRGKWWNIVVAFNVQKFYVYTGVRVNISERASRPVSTVERSASATSSSASSSPLSKKLWRTSRWSVLLSSSRLSLPVIHSHSVLSIYHDLCLTIQCWLNASHHIPIYLQPFTSYSEILVGNCNSFLPPCI